MRREGVGWLIFAAATYLALIVAAAVVGTALHILIGRTS